MDFNIFKQAVARQWERLQTTGQMYRVKIDERNELVDLYLASFPDGTNPVYRTRTEYDCSCCRHFIRAVGDCVAVIDGKLETVWDVGNLSEPVFATVAAKLAQHVRSKSLADVFLSETRTAGTDKNFEEVIGETPRQWNHFFVNIKPQFVLSKAAIPTKLNEKRTQVELLQRALTTITLDAIDTVLDLIAQNSLYKGEENRHAVQAFRDVHKRYYETVHGNGQLADLYCWTEAGKQPAFVTAIRNTSIGTLLVDLSEGRDLDSAVKAFESKVAPANYKRPTALITPKMVEQAKEKITELGLLSALDRRMAVLPDITVNNVLWADRSAKAVMNGDVFDTLTQQTSANAKVSDKIEEVPIDKFIKDILPKATSVEVLLENRLSSNLVSLIAPQDATAGRLFKWDNNFSWSYNGEVTDAIKERVKQAGGRIEGDLCCRLAWDNTDDLDFHMVEPNGGHIYFPNRRCLSPNGGILDVDANGADGRREDPVENIVYERRGTMQDGIYTLKVNHYSGTMSRSKPGFTVQVEYMGEVMEFFYPKATAPRDMITVLRFRHSKEKGMEVLLEPGSLGFTGRSAPSRNVWGLPTQTFHRVNVVCLSPNYWDGMEQFAKSAPAHTLGIGNKHYFFMLEGCKNDGSVRGFYNEFLDSRLDAHRKVFEVLASKTKPAIADDQLSGLGFSSTQRNTLTVKVKGSFTRTIKVVF